MASMPKRIDVEVTSLRIIFFPVATYARVSGMAQLTVFGVTVYKRMGENKSLFGVVV